MNYKLFVSLQRHATNPDAISLVGKTITVVEGPGAGQTATIVSYDSTTRPTRSTASGRRAGPGQQVRDPAEHGTLAGYAPVTDSYQVVLTSSRPRR